MCHNEKRFESLKNFKLRFFKLKTTRDQFKPDPRLVVDPNFVAENTKVEYEVPPPPQTPPHRRARSLVPKLQIVKDELIRVPVCFF